MTRSRTLALTLAALTGFAANSILCRGALAPRAIDAASFTLIRLASGALVLAVLVRGVGHARRPRAGSWAGALALFTYAIAFSFAYLQLNAGVGALILFGVVQATMLVGGLRAGERPRATQWAGLAIAFGGLIFLTGIVRTSGWGAQAPDPLGSAAMALAGVAWGVYSLLGRGCAQPLAATADNFLRSVPFALVASLLAFRSFDATPRGALLAAASGALASGVGYSLWYAAMRGLTATRAAIVQLSVPVLAAVGSFVVLGEPMSTRSCIAGATILAGVGLAVLRR